MFCALLGQLKISGERLQDHWSSGCSIFRERIDLLRPNFVYRLSLTRSALGS